MRPIRHMKKVVMISALLLVLTLSLGGGVASKGNDTAATYENLRLFTEVLSIVQSQYVDEVLVRGLNTDLGIVNASETYFDADLARWPCPQFWKRVTVNHLGEIRFCVEDWFNRGVVANVRDHTIQEVWQSPIYRRFRELHASGRWRDMKMCGPCMDWQHMAWDHGFEKAVGRVLARPVHAKRALATE